MTHYPNSEASKQMKSRRLVRIALGAMWAVCGAQACDTEQSGATTTEERATCANETGRVFTEGGQELCVIPQKIIEVGFDCPVNFVGLQTYGQLAICGSGTGIMPGGFEFSYSADLRDDLRLAYPQLVPRGMCASTLCGGLALCVSNGSCQIVTSTNRDAFMCADGVCTLEDLPAQQFACEDSCTPDCSDMTQWTCAEDGARYCSACTASCYGQQTADPASCSEPPTSRVEACVQACGDACGTQADQWFCASNETYYCSSCEAHCLGLAVAPPELCADALPPGGMSDSM